MDNDDSASCNFDPLDEHLVLSSENIVSDSASSKFNESPGGTKYLKPRCSADIIPNLDMHFSSIDKAFEFYKNYGRQCGFDVRRASTKRDSDGIILFKLFVCNCAGFTNGKVDEVVDSNDGHVSVRKTTTGRCGCNAKLVLKYNGTSGYNVLKFVECHNHELVGDCGRQFLRVSRSMNFGHKMWVIDASKVNIKSSMAHTLMKQMVGGYGNVGATSLDFKNFNRDVKRYIGDRDAQMMIDRFNSKKEMCPSFFFEYEMDDNGHLCRIFLSDSIAQRNYELFGDVVSFDATFRTNKYDMVFVPFAGVDNHKKSVTFAAALLSKEDIDHYTWVFNTFLKVMKRESLLFVTDQCPAMKQVVPAVFRNAKHRLCMWHIMKKFPMKIGVTIYCYKDFTSKINALIWDEYIEPKEFEDGWKDTLLEFGLEKLKWLNVMFDMRQMWIRAYFRNQSMHGIIRTTSRSESENYFFQNFHGEMDSLTEFGFWFDDAMERQRHINDKLNFESMKGIPRLETSCSLESDAALLFTRTIFYDVQDQIKIAVNQIKIQSLFEVDGVKKFVVKDKSCKNRLFEVSHKVMNNYVQCSCKLFLRIGILCSHGFFALIQGDVDKIPSEYVLNRSKKNVEHLVFGVDSYMLNNCQILDEMKLKMNDIWHDIQSLLGLAGFDKGRLEYLYSSIKDLKSHFSELNSVKHGDSNKDFFGTVLGSQPSEINVLPPNESRNKGCGKRILSSVEKLQKEKNKKPRYCKECGELGYHDKRTCPTRK